MTLALDRRFFFFEDGYRSEIDPTTVGSHKVPSHASACGSNICPILGIGRSVGGGFGWHPLHLMIVDFLKQKTIPSI